MELASRSSDAVTDVGLRLYSAFLRVQRPYDLHLAILQSPSCLPPCSLAAPCPCLV